MERGASRQEAELDRVVSPAAKNFDAADPGQNQFGDSYFPYLRRLLRQKK
jgi:hypothetical protein